VEKESVVVGLVVWWVLCFVWQSLVEGGGLVVKGRTFIVTPIPML